MKKLKFYMLALVTMMGLSSCEQHTCVEDKCTDLTGTWTSYTADYAEALVIKADGSVLSTGYDGNTLWENVAGRVEVKNGKAVMTFADRDSYKGYIDIIPGQAFSIHNAKGNRMTFQYCAGDLANKIVGMWVCNDGPVDMENDMTIQNFKTDSTYTFTGMDHSCGKFVNNEVGTYKVVGDMLILVHPDVYTVSKMVYSPNATKLGDVLVLKEYTRAGNNSVLEATTSLLRVKTFLELPGAKYAYSATYVSNVKGQDKSVQIFDRTVNFAKISNSGIDNFMKSSLFNIEFTNAKTLTYNYQVGGVNVNTTAPIAVEGNKVNIQMSQVNTVYRDVEIYAFQDAYNTQMHWYMPTEAFEKFFTNMIITTMINRGEINANDTEAIDVIYKEIAELVESINLSIVLKTAK